MRSLLLVAALMPLAGSHAADLAFVETDSVPGGVRAFADFNNDGVLDSATAVSGGNLQIVVRYGNRTGGFRDAVTFNAPSNPVIINAVDVNHDGWMDLAIQGSGPRRSDIYLNRLDGTFAAGIRTPETSPGAAAPMYGDINNDGLVDLLHRTIGISTIYCLGTGQGTFGAQTSFLTNETPVLADLNGDAHIDLVTYHDTIWRVYLNDGVAGSVSFTKVGEHTLTEGWIYEMHAAEVDGIPGDEMLMVQYISTGGTDDDAPRVLFRNIGNGIFDAGTTLDPQGPFRGVTTGVPGFADLDGDGLKELIDTYGISHATAPGVYGRQTGLAWAPTGRAFTADINDDGYLDLLGNRIAFGVPTSPGLAAVRTFVTGQSPFVALLADFDGDGKKDILTGEDHGSDGGFTLLKGAGSGSFDVVSTGTLTGIRVENGTTGDFNGDGRADAYLAARGGGGRLMYGQAGGTLSAPVAHWSSGTCLAADLTGDGRPELMGSIGYYSPIFYVHLNDGVGNLDEGTQFTAPGTGPGNFLVREVTGDSFPDLLLTTNSTGSAYVYPGNGAGGLGTPIAVATGFPNGLAGLAVHDFNDDGLPDLAIGEVVYNNVFIHLGIGVGAWQGSSSRTSINTSALAQPGPLRVADVTGDGVEDLLVVSTNAGGFVSFPSNNDGTFQQGKYIASIPNPMTLELGDVVGDGSMAAVLPCFSSNRVAVHLLRPLRRPSATITAAREMELSLAGFVSPDMLNPRLVSVGGSGAGTLPRYPNVIAETSPGNYRLTWNQGEMKAGGSIEVGLSPAMAGPGGFPIQHLERVTATGTIPAGIPPSSQITGVDNPWFVAGPATGTVDASDDDQVVRVDIYARHTEGTWALVGRRTANLDGFSAVPGTQPGTYFLQSVAYDRVGNEEAGGPPTGSAGTGDLAVVYAPLIDGPVSLGVPVGSMVELLFPLTDELSVTIILPNVTVGGSLTVERQRNAGNTVGIPENSLIPQKWIITSGTGLAWDTTTGATVIFRYDDSEEGLGELQELSDLNIVYAVENPANPPREYQGQRAIFDTARNEVRVTGVSGFSTWYIGNATEPALAAESWMLW